MEEKKWRACDVHELAERCCQNPSDRLACRRLWEVALGESQEGWRGPSSFPSWIKPPLAEFGPVGRLIRKPNTLQYYMRTRGMFVFGTKAFLVEERVSSLLHTPI